jgi:hypothetical protein
MRESSLGYFVFRAVGLQILLLGIWWTILYRPSIALLRLTAEVPLSVLLSNPLKSALEVDSSSGDWNFSVPVNAVVKDSTHSDGAVKVEAIDFTAPVENVAPFAIGWFVYLGLALSVLITRDSLRRTLKGLFLQTAISALAVFSYAEINARGTLAHIHRVPDPLSLWLLKFGYHIDYLVVPYATPFLVVLWTHPQWWAKLIGSSQITSPVAAMRRPKSSR